MSLLIPFMVVVVVGLGFVIERSSMTKNMKAVTRLAVLGIALAITFYWVRATAAASYSGGYSDGRSRLVAHG